MTQTTAVGGDRWVSETRRAREMTITRTRIADDTPAFVIAEIGHNHMGSMETCRRLFEAASQAGANAVKLQKRNNRAIFTTAMYESSYTGKNAYGETYGAHREFLEFDDAQFRDLKAYADSLDLHFFATPFDPNSADFLAQVGVPCFKIASGDLTNTPLLRHVAGLGKPMFISSGGGTMEDIQRAYDVVAPINDALCLMQCTAGYPPAWDEINLNVMGTLRANFPDTVIGFSSHDAGTAMSVAACALGARVVEKHFTLDRRWKGTDHAFSLEANELRTLVRDLQRLHLALGDGVKGQYASEAKPLFKMAKKLVFSRDLPSGHVLALADIAVKSPNDGIPPHRLEEFIGQRLRFAVRADQNLDEALLA